jgi:hypothetical protein
MYLNSDVISKLIQSAHSFGKVIEYADRYREKEEVKDELTYDAIRYNLYQIGLNVSKLKEPELIYFDQFDWIQFQTIFRYIDTNEDIDSILFNEDDDLNLANKQIQLEELNKNIDQYVFSDKSPMITLQFNQHSFQEWIREDGNLFFYNWINNITEETSHLLPQFYSPKKIKKALNQIRNEKSESVNQQEEISILEYKKAIELIAKGDLIQLPIQPQNPPKKQKGNRKKKAKNKLTSSEIDYYKNKPLWKPQESLEAPKARWTKHEGEKSNRSIWTVKK